MAWITSASSRDSYAQSPSSPLAAAERRWWRTVLQVAAAPKTMLIVLLALQLGLLVATLIAPDAVPTSTLAASIACISAVILIIFNRHAMISVPRHVHGLEHGDDAAALRGAAPISTEPRPASAIDRSQAALNAPSQSDALTTGVHASNDAWVALLHQVHHELRTPLNAVLGFTDLMQKETFGPIGSPRYVEYLTHIRDSGEALLKSTEQTLAMTSALATAEEATGPSAPKADLKSVALEAWSELQRQAGPAGFTLDMFGPACLVHADAHGLSRIFHHLYLEAISRSETSGTITLSITPGLDSVRIDILTPAPLTQDRAATPSLDMCIARTLLQLYGGALISVETAGQKWRAATTLDRAAQADFFTEDQICTPAPEAGLALKVA